MRVALKSLLVISLAAGLGFPVAHLTATGAQANGCPDQFSLVANEDLPIPAPPYGADLNRNGVQCQAVHGQVLLLTDDVTEDVDIEQCGRAFSPVQFDPTDVALTAKDRNGDGIVCIRVMEIAQAQNLELFIVRDN